MICRQPGRIQLMMARRGAEIPHKRFAIAGEQTPARQLVARPFADDGAGNVADVVLVEDEQRAQFRTAECSPRTCQPVFVQTPKVHALLEIDLYSARRLQWTVPAMPRIPGVV